MKSKDLRLLLSVSGSRSLFIASIFNALIATSIVIANGFLIAAVIVGLIYRHPNIQTHLFLLGSLWLFRAIYTSQFERWASSQAARVKSELREKVLTSPQGLSTLPATELSTLLIKGANSLDIYIGRFLPQIIAASATPVAVILVLGYLDMTSALIALMTVPLIPFFGALIGRYTNDAVQSKWRSLGTLGKYFEDSLRGIYTLSIFGRAKSQGARIREMGDRYTNETMKVLRISFLSALVLELAATISVALIAVSIGLRLVGGSMEFFPALAILVLAPEVYFPLRNAASLFHASADGGEALTQLSTIAESESGRPLFGDRTLGEISEIKAGEWSSPYGDALLPAFTITQGEVLIIRGPSGIGKSTFVHSLLGLRDGTGVWLNGVDLQDYSLNSIRENLGWIPQNPTLSVGTLRQLFLNLNQELTDLDIEALLASVGLQLGDLHDGLETLVGGGGEKSARISGGQRRKIAIARALVRNPALIIADEPTADLDPASAQQVLHELNKRAAEGAIVIAIIHAADQTITGAKEIQMAVTQ